MGSTGADHAPLAAAVDGLYTAFSSYRYRPDMPVCRHCVKPGEVAALAGSVRELTVEALEPFAWKAITLWGGGDDLRRALPRLLELLAAQRLPVPAPLLATKLRDAGWRAWDAGEQDAIVGFLAALWRTTLGRWPATPDAAACIATLDLTVDDFQPYLEEWHLLLDADQSRREPAVRHLIGTIHRLGAAVEPGAMRRLLWGNDEGATTMSALAVWLTGATTVIQLERATFDYAGLPLADAATDALARLAGAAT